MEDIVTRYTLSEETHFQSKTTTCLYELSQVFYSFSLRYLGVGGMLSVVVREEILVLITGVCDLLVFKLFLYC